MRNILRCMAVADKEVAQKVTALGIIDFILLFVIMQLMSYSNPTDLIEAVEIILFIIVVLIAVYIGRSMYKSGKKNLEE